MRSGDAVRHWAQTVCGPGETDPRKFSKLNVGICAFYCIFVLLKYISGVFRILEKGGSTVERPRREVEAPRVCGCGRGPPTPAGG